MIKRIFISLSLVCLYLAGTAQNRKTDYSSSAILQKLESVNTLGSVMYIAAHPDDENTRLIAFIRNGLHLRTAYLAATRGDGGQNLIGPEIREGLGVIRTQELQAARYVDGGEQFFSRANDFGYSKHPDETFNVWDREKVLADFVWAIRKFRPDVLFTRFSQEPGITHGHHTASAILAMEAFKLSGDPKAFPEQLQYVEPWQPTKIFYNIGLWAYRAEGREFDDTGYFKLDVGAYNAHLGKSYTEISALSRSMHKSQGFGDTGVRGTDYEYFKQWGGAETGDIFGGVDFTWARVGGSELVAKYLNEARDQFDPSAPFKIIDPLLNARKELVKLPEGYWKKVKLAEIDQLIMLVTGTYIELKSSEPFYTPGDTMSVSLEVINRNETPIKLSSISFSISDEQYIHNLWLEPNKKNEFSFKLKIPEAADFTNPYWLNEPGTEGMYTVNDQLLIGLPENPPAVTGEIMLLREGHFMKYTIPVNFKKNDPVRGEVIDPLEISPAVMINMDAQALIFSSASPKKVEVELIAGKVNVSGRLDLKMPDGWKVTPAYQEFALKMENEEQIFTFEITPPKDPSVAVVKASVNAGGHDYTQGRKIINYDHIPKQTIYPQAEVKVVKLPAAAVSGRIGYIMGAGDEVPFALQQIGYQVDMLDKDQIRTDALAGYDAVILGVRAFNTLPWLAFKNQDLFEYVKQGGNLIVQYNTNQRLVTDQIAPYDLKLSRDRVTVENSPVKVLAPKHPVMNKPYKIEQADFDGWVQERGLYYPNVWSKEFTEVLDMNDPGESIKPGSLLVAKYGKGYYCYTGLSFFRELPAGVPGAYKLLVNMISLKEEK